jgi:hypothetical protein
MDARVALYEIKMKLLSGIISYEEAKKQSIPFIEELNIMGKNIAKKYGRKFLPTTFSQQMR